MMNSAFRGAMVAMALCLALTFSLSADTLTADYTNQPFGSIVVNYSTPYKSGSAAAGMFLMERTDLPVGPGGYTGDPLPLGKDFYAFCIELLEVISDGTVYDVVNLEDGRTTEFSPIGAERADLVAAVLGSAGYTNFALPIPGATSGERRLLSAAIQVAIWEVVYEGLRDAGQLVLGVSTGNTRFTSANASVLAKANEILAGVPNAVRAPNLLALNSGSYDPYKSGRQDLVIQIPGTPNVEVPEPGTMGLLGLGLLGLGVLRRKFVS